MSEKDRAKYDRIKRKHTYIVPYHKPNTLKSPESRIKKDEDIFAATLDMLMEGMRKGNIRDKVAAESLLNAIRYRNVSISFLTSCEQKYIEATKPYEDAISRLQSLALCNPPDPSDQHVDSKVTNRILLPDIFK